KIKVFPVVHYILIGEHTHVTSNAQVNHLRPKCTAVLITLPYLDRVRLFAVRILVFYIQGRQTFSFRNTSHNFSIAGKGHTRIPVVAAVEPPLMHFLIKTLTGKILCKYHQS